MRTHFILYVANQESSTKFYSTVLDIQPTLNVPGMTEFTFSDSCVLGLMPEKGIKRLLGESLPDPSQAHGVPRSEIYLHVADPNRFHRRALNSGAKELSAVAPRDWGDLAGYSIDQDGHVIAFAKTAAMELPEFKISVNSSIYISDITAADKPAYIEHLQERQIHDQTLNIPFPYTEADADWWINRVAEETQKQGRSVNWAIRNKEGALIGGIGFHDFRLGQSHKAELGYWLAKSYWGQGIMTDAAKKIAEFGLSEFGLSRITANVFDFNLGSTRVLEKAGFQLEGLLRNHYKKNGKIFNGKLYARVRE